MFHYRGPIVLSKSWLNRFQIIQHYLQNPAEKTKIDESFMADDVRDLHKALQQVTKDQKFYLGLGGTSFRFFCFLISRYKGEFEVSAHPQLLARPQNELIEILQQLGVKAEFNQDRFKIVSEGWTVPDTMTCSGHISTQFVSGLLLNSWKLSDPLKIEIKKPIVSSHYLDMTIVLLKKSGMQIRVEESSDLKIIYIPPNQVLSNLNELKPEADVSSLFSLAAAAVVGGDIEILNFTSQSSQPDIVFLDYFKKMNISFIAQEGCFKIKKQTSWTGLECNLKDHPDLFPVLSVLASLSGQASELRGAEHLKYKESDRLKKTYELLSTFGFKVTELSDGIKIDPFRPTLNQEVIYFDTDHDHRMAMAAALLQLSGYKINILNREAVSKSYPNFWKDIAL